MRTKQEIWFSGTSCSTHRFASDALGLSGKLNPEQRRAVEHGVRQKDCASAGPLLVTAGAGSGKTNTLAHRVAHLIVNGADPRRILLMTFSRRAAGEMTRRVERICAQAMGVNAGIVTDAFAWAGTFHGIGARILRDYAEQIGLDPSFTIHDREDAADLMNLARHELGFSKSESRFPTKGTCLAIYSRAVNAELPLEDVLRVSFPWCAGWRAQLRDLFAAYVEAKQAQNVLDYDDLLLYWAQTVGEPALAEDIGGRFDHVLVDEYQDTNRLQSSILLALKRGGRDWWKRPSSRPARPVNKTSGMGLPSACAIHHPVAGAARQEISEWCFPVACATCRNARAFRDDRTRNFGLARLAR